MADTKITALTALTAADPANDVLPIVDVSDTTMAASGTTKKISVNNILGASGTATLASATITGDLTVRTNKLAVTSTGVGVGTASPLGLFHLVTTAAGYSDAGYFENSQAAAANVGPRLSLLGVGSVAMATIDAGWNAAANTDSYLRFLTRGTSSVAERYRIASDGVATWSNVGGVAGTAMTLNSTGLGVGAIPGGSTGNSKIAIVGGTTYDGNFDIIGNFTDSATASTAKGVLLGYNNSTNNGIISAAYGGGTEGLTFWTHNGSSWGQRMELTATGNVGIGVTPSAGKGCLQLSSGINFPATQVASTDPNTLDDYEEGTWTATLKGSVSDPTTPVTATGRYTKIGRQVYVQVAFADKTTTGASGNVSIEGLPFANNASISSQGTILSDQAITFTGSPFALIDVAASKMLIYQSSSNASATSCTHNAGGGRYLYANVTYTV